LVQELETPATDNIRDSTEAMYLFQQFSTALLKGNMDSFRTRSQLSSLLQTSCLACYRQFLVPMGKIILKRQI